jgi:hypothetical protein
VALGLPKPNHPLVRLRMLISLWGVIHGEARRRVFTLAQQNQIERYYQGELGWRPRQIGHLLGLFTNWAYLHDQQDQAELDKYVKESFGDEAGMEARYQELGRLLEEQTAAVEAAFADEMKAQEEKDAIARDSCLAPEDETANMVLRLEMALDRAIDRKVKILLTMRKEHAKEAHTSRQKPSGRMRHPSAASPPGQESNDREVKELSKLVGLDAPKGDADMDINVATQDGATESPKEETASVTTKGPEQSENVIENKGPAAEGVSVRERAITEFPRSSRPADPSLRGGGRSITGD